MSVVTDVPVASFNARWNAAYAKLGPDAKPSAFVRELSLTLGSPVPSLRQVEHKLCTERRRSLSPAEAKAFRSRNAERKAQQRKRLKEETVPERAERVAAEAEQKAKAKVAEANEVAAALSLVAHVHEEARRTAEEARRTAEAQRQLGICNALQEESNRRLTRQPAARREQDGGGRLHRTSGICHRASSKSASLRCGVAASGGPDA